MLKRVTWNLMLTLFCTIVLLSAAACGVSRTAAQNGAELRVTFSKHGAAPTPVTDLHDTQAITRLYNAALALPKPKGTLFSCPADNGGIYHLTFSGSELLVHDMDAKSSGCPILTLTATNDTRWMDSNFISLFTSTVGLPSLDPTFP